MARVAPIFSLKPTLKQDGTTVVFTAEVEAVPKPTAAWFRGETKVEASDRAKARLEQVGKSSKYKVLLTITNASVDDSGVYKVEVKNSLGKKSATINLDLKGKHYCFSNCSYETPCSAFFQDALYIVVVRGGALVASIPFNRRVAGSNLALAATYGPWASPSLTVAYRFGV